MVAPALRQILAAPKIIDLIPGTRYLVLILFLSCFYLVSMQPCLCPCKGVSACMKLAVPEVGINGRCIAAGPA